MPSLTNAHMWLQASRERRPDRSYTLLILWHAVEQKTTQAVPKFYEKYIVSFNVEQIADTAAEAWSNLR